MSRLSKVAAALSISCDLLNRVILGTPGIEAHVYVRLEANGMAVCCEGLCVLSDNAHVALSV